MSRSRARLQIDRARLARIFGAIVVAVAPTSAVMIACDSVSDPQSEPDATSSSVTSDAAIDAGSEPIDAGPSCFIEVTYFDSGVYYDGGDGAVDLGCIYTLPCGVPPTLMTLGCGVYYTDTVDSSLPDAHAYAGCDVAEGQGCTSGTLTPGDGGLVGIICTDCLGGGGRRPRGLQPLKQVRSRTRVGAYFAQMAHEESASVHAFHRMKQELSRFGAPDDLVHAAARAEREEMLHTAMMKHHTQAYGGACSPARTKKTDHRSLEAMAIENAVEGCVNETFGALLMTWQAEHAASMNLRDTFAKIAQDEIGHAALSHSVAAWAGSQLDARAQNRVKRARERAVRKLERSQSAYENRVFSDQLAREVGWPTPSQRSELIQKMLTALSLV